LIRFVRCRNLLGRKWKSKIANDDPFFKTKLGQAYVTSVAQAYLMQAEKMGIVSSAWWSRWKRCGNTGCAGCLALYLSFAGIFHILICEACVLSNLVG